uniref:Uncharacterized protein n=1 Tax=Nicotiana tabacum TaxID=4097 RepID=A0A1S3YIH1_TOBAC|nr:PREDICTED: uncharacterized protein LOC107776655 [Nicotiana tabacum]
MSRNTEPLLDNDQLDGEEKQAVSRRGNNDDVGFVKEFGWESKRLWELAGPAIFTTVCQYSLGALTQTFAGQIGELELAAVSIENSVITGLAFGVMIFVAENEFEEGAEVSVERSHQGSNAAATPPPTTTQPQILEVEKERIVKDGFDGFSHDLHYFGDNEMNSYGPEDADGAEELPDIVSWAAGDEGLVDSLATQYNHPDGTGLFLGKYFDNKLDLMK